MIVVVGSLNCDHVVRVERHPRPGETVLGSGHTRHLGGKGANQAVAAARLGSSVRMVGCVGDDPEGRAFRAALAGEGIDVSRLADVGAPTGAAFIAVDAAGQNAISVSPGANLLLAAAHLDAAAFEGARAAVLQLEIPLAAVRRAASLARAAGARVILNAAPALPLTAEELTDVDLLVVNEHEGAALLGEAAPAASVGEALSLARRLQRRAPAAIVTLGEHGAVLADASGARHEPAIAVAPVDT
ncbi:MAG TPA: ribokinase, partial [Vicinamibacteria bacterium]|nr:ribokinase [Vicinamibacteria bacterium]